MVRRYLHAMLRPTCRPTTFHLHSSPILSRPVSHFPTRRKRNIALSIVSARRISTSPRNLQDPLPQPVYQSPPPDTENEALPSNPSTVPKLSIMANMMTGLRTQNNDYVRPASRPSLNESLDLLDLMGPDRSRKPTQRGFDQAKLARDLSDTPLPGTSKINDISLRLKPTLGRTLSTDLTRNVDLTTAFRRLERRCIENNVKVDERTQRIYVRRGQRIKELRSRRWRALFQQGFLHECARIRRMKKQGW